MTISSYLMTNITTFRNLHGKEENWQHPDSIDPNSIPYSFYAKSAAAQLGFGLAAVIATIEFFVYGIFMILSMPVYYLGSNSLSHHSLKLFEYSTTSLKWASDNFRLNLSTYNLETEKELNWFDEMKSDTSFLRKVNKLLKNEALFLKIKLKLRKIVHETHQFDLSNGLIILNNVLKRKENKSLQEDLKSECSPSAFQLLAFLFVAECIQKKVPSLDFFNANADSQLKEICQIEGFGEKLSTFIKNYTGNMNPLRFDDFVISSKNTEEEQKIFNQTRAISENALQGSPRFSTLLSIYLDLTK